MSLQERKTKEWVNCFGLGGEEFGRGDGEFRHFYSILHRVSIRTVPLPLYIRS